MKNTVTRHDPVEISLWNAVQGEFYHVVAPGPAIAVVYIGVRGTPGERYWIMWIHSDGTRIEILDRTTIQMIKVLPMANGEKVVIESDRVSIDVVV